jgi:hypothetical protein
MRLQVGVLLVGIGEFSRFRTSWHTIGTLDWSDVAPWKYLLKRPRMTAVTSHPVYALGLMPDLHVRRIDLPLDRSAHRQWRRIEVRQRLCAPTGIDLREM